MSKKVKLNDTMSVEIQPSQLWGYVGDQVTTSTTASTLGFSTLLNTIITEKGVEQIFREDSCITYTTPFGNQSVPRIYKNVYRIVKGKLKLTETIEGKYIPQKEESYEF